MISQTIVGEQIVNAELSDNGEILCVLTQNQIHFYSVSENGMALLSSTDSAEPTRNIILALSNDGRYALTAANDHSVNLWHMDGGLLLNTPPFESEVWQVGFTPNNMGFWGFAGESAWINTLPHVPYEIFMQDLDDSK